MVVPRRSHGKSAWACLSRPISMALGLSGFLLLSYLSFWGVPRSGITSLISSNQQSKVERPYAFVVGLPKSGTTSIYHFFSCSGYPTTHYCCCGTNSSEYPCAGGKLISQQLKDNIEGGRSFWEGTGDQFVHAQLDGESKTETYFLPQHYRLQELHDSAPNAIWILPLRPAIKWKASVEKWLDMADRLKVVYERESSPKLKVSRTFDLEIFYEDHTKLIRNFCQNGRSDSSLCIEVDIENSNAGNYLATHFPNALPSCWGRHNAGPFFQSYTVSP